MEDQTTSMERAAEDRILEMTKGMPPGFFRCRCGQPEELAHATPSGRSPYSEPMCRGCSRRVQVQDETSKELPRG